MKAPKGKQLHFGMQLVKVIAVRPIFIHCMLVQDRWNYLHKGVFCFTSLLRFPLMFECFRSAGSGLAIPTKQQAHGMPPPPPPSNLSQSLSLSPTVSVFFSLSPSLSLSLSLSLSPSLSAPFSLKGTQFLDGTYSDMLEVGGVRTCTVSPLNVLHVYSATATKVKWLLHE